MRVDKHHFDTDKAFVDGMECGVNMVKGIFELTVSERINRFGMTDVASILDSFDFAQIKELLKVETPLA